MHVGRVMETTLVTVAPDTSLSKAQEIIDAKGIKHLLVVGGEEALLGMVSDRDLKRSWASPATTLSVHELNYLLARVTVDMIMAKTVISISPDTTIERAAHIMQTNAINALPVIEADQLVGIITSTDVMKVLLQAIGIDKDSTRLTVLVRDRIGVIAEAASLLKGHQINIRSLVTLPEKRHPGVYHMVLRVSAQDGERAAGVLRDGGFKVLTAYTRDLTPYLPED